MDSGESNALIIKQIGLPIRLNLSIVAIHLRCI